MTAAMKKIKPTKMTEKMVKSKVSPWRVSYLLCLWLCVGYMLFDFVYWSFCESWVTGQIEVLVLKKLSSRTIPLQCIEKTSMNHILPSMFIVHHLSRVSLLVNFFTTLVFVLMLQRTERYNLKSYLSIERWSSPLERAGRPRKVVDEGIFLYSAACDVESKLSWSVSEAVGGAAVPRGHWLG